MFRNQCRDTENVKKQGRTTLWTKNQKSSTETGSDMKEIMKYIK